MARFALLVLAASALFLSSCAALAQRSANERTQRAVSRGSRGAVAGGVEFSVEAGMRTFHRGGNAVDAGIAAMFAGAVTEFSHFGFGGEAPILIREANGKVHSIAGVGRMPMAATADFFRQHEMAPGEVQMVEPGGLKHMVPVAGLLPALTPSMVEAGLIALRDFGTISFAEAIRPAIELADGYPIDETRSTYINRTRRFLSLWPSSAAVFRPEDATPQPGSLFRQADLARTMRRMVEAEAKALKTGANRKAAIDAVRDFFYRGEIAEEIGAFVEKNKGLLRTSDMNAFRLSPEEAVCVDFREYTVCKPGFWSQGPAMLQTLRLLDGTDLKDAGFNSAAYIHRVVEALKLAYADRDAWYGDPRFSKVPAERLLSKEYAQERRALITDKASLEFLPGDRGRHPSGDRSETVRIDDALMAKDTTCVTAVDAKGTMISITPSGAWLPSVIAGSTGIPLTQRAQSFLLTPGHPNELAPGKRPRVTLSPTLVLKQGKPYAVLSTPGGDNQEQALIQVLLNMTEFGMNPQAAVEAPRFQTRHLVSSFDNHAMSPGDLLLDERISGPVQQDLARRGHRIEQRSRFGSGAAPVAILVREQGVLEAGADPYSGRIAAAW
jgi:gamma-glutamyltranspeptidase / glutathione hydrolase